MRRAALLALCLLGCQSGLDATRPPPALDEPYFRCKVQPVLAKSCAMFACHGDGRRFFRVFARNRLRLGGVEKDRNGLLRPEERSANLAAARAMVDPDAPARSLLLLKPLESSAGGEFHRGATLYGAGNVFPSRDDPDFKVLDSWVHGATEDASCIEPGSDL